MIDVLQTMPLRPEVQPDLEARYRVHGPDAPESVKATIRGLVTNGHAGASRELIDSLPKLEIIVSSSVGYDHIDVEYARSKGIPVTNTAGSLDDDVADLAIALMIMTARRLVPSDKYVRDNRWAKEGDYPLQRRASGKRVGILGLGRIGQAIARRAEAMNNTIAYHSRREVAGSPYKYYPTLVELAKNSDFLVVIIPASPESHKIVNKEVLEALGPTGIIVNVARGTVVDEEAMIAALKAGTLGGAGLDVFYDEPRVPDVFFGMENVVLMPHVGSATVETRRAMSQLTLDNLDAHFAGRKLLTPI
ncbi:MAG TPA: 2-hydroxyacid dehydrogenase [Rhizomicrobium sp.]|jgi:hydroxypyruvate reductase 2|nr:2-hydroxyacid dehydrogenase [Rhizomicrobium sp.]